jgi:DNA-binding NtrC family response regulator
MTGTVVADRFVMLPDRVRDLATDAPVWLRIEQAGDAAAQLAWSDRAAALASLHHPRLAPCLDFGTMGAGQRFEAFALPEPVLVAHETRDAQRARRAVSLFLGAAGVPSGRLSVVGGPRGPLVVPGAFVTAEPATMCRRPHALAHVGLQVGDSRLRSALAEWLREEPPPGLSLLRVAMPIGGGGRTLLRDAARLGRLAGWLPIALVAWHRVRHAKPCPPWLESVEGRHVLLLHDARRAPSDSPSALLDAATARMPWRLLQIVEPGTARTALHWRPMSAGALAASVIAPADPAEIAARVRRAAERSGGLPGAFIAELHGSVARHLLPRPTTSAGLVHEARSRYAADEPSVQAPSPGSEIAVNEADRAVRFAERQVLRGRAAAGDRWLRRSAGRLHRRGQDAAAAEVLVASARRAVERGRPAESLRLLDEVQALVDRAGLAAPALVASIWRGRALLDLLELDRALAVLRTAVAAADVTGAGNTRRWAVAGLVRALWWSGRASDAPTLLDIAAPLARPDAPCMDRARLTADDLLLAVVEHGWAVRIALALGSVDAAAGHAAVVAGLARGVEDRSVQLAAVSVRMRLLAGVADYTSLLDQLPHALALCRETRRPLEAVKCRLVALEACVRGGARAEARRLAHRLRRTERAVSPFLAARIAIARAAANGHADGSARQRLLSRGFVLQGSAAPASLGSLSASVQRSAMFDDVMQVIQACQEHEDPTAALRDVVEILRARLAATVAQAVSKAPGPVAVASPAHHRGSLASGQRALEHGTAIAPQEIDQGYEAAAPVRYGGLVVGAVACRWAAATPPDAERIVQVLGAAAAALSPVLRSIADDGERPIVPLIEAEILGVSAAMGSVRRMVAQAADAPFPVMVYGESGVGKELVARALHRAGSRRARGLCAVNCAALPDDLLEAELFGHVRGAFTGAVADRRGLFEEADGGVLFLDEVGELSARAQAKLLRVLQESEVRRLGDTLARRVDVRIVAATNRLLEREVEQGRFRRDLRYRLDVIRIVVPPLRERPEDVPVLVHALWPRIAGRMGSRARLTEPSVAALSRYDWPGNVRELQNVLAVLAVSAPRRGTIGPSALPSAIAHASLEPGGEVTLDEARRRFEERFVRAALARAGGHRGRAAASLGLTRQGLSKLLGRLGVDVTPAAQAVGTPAAHT